MILYLASDLLWASKIKGTAEAMGIHARPVRSLEMLQSRLGDSPPADPVKALVVDLEAGPLALELIGHLRSLAQHATIRVLAFGPHVNVDTLEAARVAGAELVLPRGAFASRLPSILRELDSA